MKKAVITITNRFDKNNFNYPWSNPKGNSELDITIANLRKVLLDDFKQMFDGIELIGNSFLHPQLKKVLGVIKPLKLSSFEIFIPTKTRLNNVKKLLLQGGVTGIKLYAGGINASTHDALLGQGSFRVFEENIEMAKKEGLGVTIEFLVTRKNIQSLPEAISYAIERQVAINFNELMPLGEAKKRGAWILDARSAADFWNALASWKEHRNLPDVTGYSNYLDNYHGCKYARTVFIDETGRAQKCLLNYYFTDNGKNDVHNKKCADCFSWKSGKAPKSQTGSALKKDDKKQHRIIKDVLEVYEELKLVDQSKLDTRMEALKISKGVLCAENLTAIAGAFSAAKRLEGLEVDWQSAYMSKANEGIFLINARSNVKKIKEIIGSLNYSGLKTISIMGEGKTDILLFSGLKEMLGFLKKLGFFVRIYLSGQYFKKSERTLAGMQIREYLFEVYGANANTHDQITGNRGSFDRIMEGIEALLEKKDKEKFAMGLCYFLTEKNAAELGQMVDFAGMLNMNIVVFSANDKNPRIGKDLIPSPKTLAAAKDICAKASESSKDRRIQVVSLGQYNVYHF